MGFRASNAVARMARGCAIVGIVFWVAPEVPGEAPVSSSSPTRAASTRPAGGDWPMHRGGQRLLGVAEGNLPDALKLSWKFKTAGAIKSSPAVAAGSVFIGSDDGKVYAVDLAGKQRWAFATEDVVQAAPLVLEGKVYAGSADGNLYCLDAAAGTLKWKYATEGKVLGAANWARLPEGRKTLILVGSYDSRLHAVDAATGAAVWTYQTENYVNGSPAVGDGRAVFGGCDGVLHVVALDTGRKLAAVELGSYVAGSAALADGQAFVGHYGQKFLCADTASRRIVWEYEDRKFPYFSSPAVGSDRVVFGGRDKRVHCVSRRRGERLWTFTTGGNVDSSPVICGDKVVVGSDDGRLYLLKLADGKECWSHEIGQPISGSPAVAGGKVYVGAEDGYLYCFGPTR